VENNPEVMTQLATTLGLSPDLQFYDVYSLDEPDLLAHIPRPVFALLVIIPLTPAWHRDRQAEDAGRESYEGFGPDEPVLWFKQTIGHACGSIGLLHSVLNGPAVAFIQPGSDLEAIRNTAIPLQMTDRAEMLYNNLPFERAHRSVEHSGDTHALPTTQHTGLHFLAYVTAAGRLWELEGSRQGPLERGRVAEGEDVLSPRLLQMGIKRIMRVASEGGEKDLRFSCIALARRTRTVQ
ncbi:hypothetical protein ASPZODRAFT_70660, partial [Penicilliopsis zonata CBS 506.65]